MLRKPSWCCQQCGRHPLPVSIDGQRLHTRMAKHSYIHFDLCKPAAKQDQAASVMVGLTPEYRPRPIKLLQQHNMCHLMVQNHVGQPDLVIGPRTDLLGVPKGATCKQESSRNQQAQFTFCFAHRVYHPPIAHAGRLLLHCVHCPAHSSAPARHPANSLSPCYLCAFQIQSTSLLPMICRPSPLSFYLARALHNSKQHSCQARATLTRSS